MAANATVAIGYDIIRAVAPGKPAQLVFTAEIPGRFEIELEDTATQIAEDAEMLGGSVAPSVGADGFGWTISVPGQHAEAALEDLARAVVEEAEHRRDEQYEWNRAPQLVTHVVDGAVSVAVRVAPRGGRGPCAPASGSSAPGAPSRKLHR